jgi:hypothetical protein
MADMINHETMNSDVYMYIDSVRKCNTHYHFKGWIVAMGDQVQGILYDNYELEVTFTDRHDVLEIYKTPMGTDAQYGVEFKIAFEDYDQFKGISIVVPSQTIPLGYLHKWVVYHSGFSVQSEDKGLISVDNFYDDPDLVREFATKWIRYSPSEYHKGERATNRFILNGTKEKLEKIIGKEIYNWNHGGYANGIFQFCTADQPIVYHVDTQTYAGIVYLTPDAPPSAGTSFYKSKINGRRSFPGDDRSSQEYLDTFKGISSTPNFYDGTQFELVDTVGNVYNRLVLFDASQIHAATEYFGDDLLNSRLFHMFFFDVKLN